MESNAKTFPIHTARHIASNQSSTLFSLHGLTNYAPAPISTLGIQGYTLDKQIAFEQYATNISCFLYATVKGSTIRVSDRPLGLINDVAGTTLPPPTVRFTISRALSSDQSTKILNSLGPAASIETSGKTKIYHAPSFPFQALPTILQLSNDHFNPGRDYVNPAGFYSFTIINSIIATFLRTHSYSAFRDESDESLFEMNMLLAGHTATLENRITGKGNNARVVFDPKEYSARLLDYSEPEDVEEEAPDDVQDLREAAGRIYGTGRDAVHKAKPCTSPQANIGTRSAVPNEPGLLFPYFLGLVQPDSVFLHSTILHHFRQLLGSTNQEIQKNFLAFRRGCGSLSTSSQGMALTHILFGVTLAIQTQARCFMLIEAGQYNGFVLLGARFVVFDSVKWCAPGSEEELHHALTLLDPHKASVAELVRLISGLPAEQYTGPVVVSETFEDPNNLIPLFKGVVVKNVDASVLREIDTCLHRLNYSGEGYIARDPTHIATALQDMANASTDLKITVPTYFPSINVDISAKAFKILSRFGPEAVSFWDDKGTEIRLEGKATTDTVDRSGKRKRGEVDQYGNLPKIIISSAKTLGSAVKDMDKCIEKGMIKVNLGERARNHRGTVIANDKDRKAVWDALVSMVGDKGQAGKRVRVEEPLQEGEVSTDALLALLG